VFLSVVIPFYNEGKTAQGVIDDHIHQMNMLSARLEGWEIVCLDDASQDDTWNVLSAAAGNNTAVRIIRHDQNQGIVAAFSRLFREAKGTHIYLTGGDGQWPASNLGILFNQWAQTGDDLIIGVRRNRYLVYGPWRTMLSYGFNTLGFFITGFNGRDINGIKLGRREIFIEPVKSRSFFAEIERLQKALRRGYRVSHAPVVFCQRAQGRAQGARLKNIADTLKDFLKHLTP